MVENWYEYCSRLRCYVSSWGVNTWKVFFLVGVGEIMVEDWYEYYFRLRCYVSSWGVNTWKVLSFWWGLEKFG